MQQFLCPAETHDPKNYITNHPIKLFCLTVANIHQVNWACRRPCGTLLMQLPQCKKIDAGGNRRGMRNKTVIWSDKIMIYIHPLSCISEWISSLSTAQLQLANTVQAIILWITPYIIVVVLL